MTEFAFTASTRRKQKAYEDTGCQDAGGLPIIGIPALLKLTDWIGQKRAGAAHGGDSCNALDQIPPVQRQTKTNPAIESALGGTAGRDAKTRSAKIPSHHRKATARTTKRRGGGA